MNWHRWYWWTWPAGIAIGLLWSFMLMCVIPPRQTAGDWLRGWKTLFLRMIRRSKFGS